ncbi:MAG: alpha/beta hydrolase, partial [Psychroserpens sp.]|nr:alpha/beta hydrolase [Psychroserpens sp.]
ICIDLLGHGQTGCLGYIHTMEAMAETVHAVLEHLQVDKITLIGHSMGGYVSLAFAEKYPELIDEFVLMNSTFLADSPEKKTNRDRAIEAVKQDASLFISVAIVNLFAVHNQKKFKKEIELVKKEALKTPVQGIVAAIEGMKVRPDRTHVLQNKTFRKHIIIGREDPVLDYDILMSHLKDLDVNIVEFPDGHMSHFENKKELNYKILHLSEK